MFSQLSSFYLKLSYIINLEAFILNKVGKNCSKQYEHNYMAYIKMTLNFWRIALYNKIHFLYTHEHVKYFGFKSFENDITLSEELFFQTQVKQILFKSLLIYNHV